MKLNKYEKTKYSNMLSVKLIIKNFKNLLLSLFVLNIIFELIKKLLKITKKYALKKMIKLFSINRLNKKVYAILDM